MFLRYKCVRGREITEFFCLHTKRECASNRRRNKNVAEQPTATSKHGSSRLPSRVFTATYTHVIYRSSRILEASVHEVSRWCGGSRGRARGCRLVCIRISIESRNVLCEYSSLRYSCNVTYLFDVPKLYSPLQCPIKIVHTILSTRCFILSSV